MSWVRDYEAAERGPKTRGGQCRSTHRLERQDLEDPNRGFPNGGPNGGSPDEALVQGIARKTVPNQETNILKIPIRILTKEDMRTPSTCVCVCARVPMPARARARAARARHGPSSARRGGPEIDDDLSKRKLTKISKKTYKLNENVKG